MLIYKPILKLLLISRLYNCLNYIQRGATVDPRKIFNFGEDNLLNEIGKNSLRASGFKIFGGTCTYLNSLFHKAYPLYKQHLPEFKLLINHITNGELQQADSLITSYPDLLNYSGGNIMDAGKKRKLVNRTALQIALIQQNERMILMLEKHFNNMPGGKYEMIMQFKDQFPLGLPANKSYREELENLADLIIADKSIVHVDGQYQPGIETRNAIQAFKNKYAPKVTDEFKEGVCFDLQMLVDVMNVHAAKFNDPSWKQNAVYCTKVFGLVENWLPIDIVQMFCATDKIDKVIAGTSELIQSHTIHDGSNFFSDKLGEDHFVFAGWRGPGGGMSLWVGEERAKMIEDMCIAKTKCIAEFAHRLGQPANGYHIEPAEKPRRRLGCGGCVLV